MKKIVVTVPCESYQSCEAAVSLACKKAGMKIGKSVFLKVNLLQAASPQRAITTHPEILRAMIHHLGNRDIVVGESSGGRDVANTDAAIKVAGIRRVCEEEGVEVLNLSKEIGKRKVGEFTIPEVVLDRDVVSLAKLKTHSFTGYTGAVKNLFGCLPGAQKWEMHQKYPEKSDFLEMLFRLHDVIKPRFSLIDGIWGMEGDGPASGTPKHSRVIIAGNDAIATDIVASRTIGVPFARSMEIESINEQKIDFKKAVPKFEAIPAPIRRVLAGLVWMRPEVSEKKCVKCGVCAKNCPVGAIEMKPYPKIDREKCIKCFCCHELCPHKAMEIGKSLFSRVLFR